MSSDAEVVIGKLPQIEVCKVYKIRWLILSIFVLYSASNAMQWIQYSIIANVIVDYYGVGFTAVDWTSMIYMILYIPFIFPGSYMLDRLVSFQTVFLYRSNALFIIFPSDADALIYNRTFIFLLFAVLELMFVYKA